MNDTTENKESPEEKRGQELLGTFHLNCCSTFEAQNQTNEVLDSYDWNRFWFNKLRCRRIDYYF